VKPGYVPRHAGEIWKRSVAYTYVEKQRQKGKKPGKVPRHVRDGKPEKALRQVMETWETSESCRVKHGKVPRHVGETLKVRGMERKRLHPIPA
jgi:hypothetical protein